MKLTLTITLLSDTTFGRGDGVSGVVDQEVEHDPATGLPFVRGRTLKGLLVETCADLLYALEYADAPGKETLRKAAWHLFGSGSSGLNEGGSLHVGSAQLDAALRQAILVDLSADMPTYQPTDVLEAFTAIRRQTAVNETTGAPERGSLRASRVALRNLTFYSELDIFPDDDQDALVLLAACVASVQRGGSGRNRGRGRLKLTLENSDTVDWLTHFEQTALREIDG